MKLFAKWRVALAIAGAVAGIFLLLTINMNRSQPSSDEYAVAQQLVSAAKSHTNQAESVLFEASRNAVVVNIYSVTGPGSQQTILDALKQAAVKSQFRGAIAVNFYTSREIQTLTNESGRRISSVKKGDLLRHVQIQ
jgi:hypothetical protein